MTGPSVTTESPCRHPFQPISETLKKRCWSFVSHLRVVHPRAQEPFHGRSTALVVLTAFIQAALFINSQPYQQMGKCYETYQQFIYIYISHMGKYISIWECYSTTVNLIVECCWLLSTSQSSSTTGEALLIGAVPMLSAVGRCTRTQCQGKHPKSTRPFCCPLRPRDEGDRWGPWYDGDEMRRLRRSLLI